MDQTDLLRIRVECLMRKGAYLDGLEQLEQALAASRQSVALAERLAESAQEDQTRQDLLALCVHNLGNNVWHARDSSESVVTRQRNREEAKRLYRRAIAIRERLDPKVLPGLAQKLSQSYLNLGIVLWNDGEISEAEQQFRRAEELLRSDPREVLGPGDNIHVDLSSLYLNWSGMLSVTARFDKAIEKADAGLREIEPYLQRVPNHSGARIISLRLHGNRALALGAIDKHAESARDWARVIELSDQPVPQLPRIRIAIELAHAGDIAAAVGHADHVNSVDGVLAEDCHDLAYLYSLSATAARSDQSIPRAQRDGIVQSRVSKAVRWLKAAAEKGIYKDLKLLKEDKDDPAFQILRDCDEFRKIFGTSAAKP
jgi:tetratricopeptide (TPR) repeat protein